MLRLWMVLLQLLPCWSAESNWQNVEDLYQAGRYEDALKFLEANPSENAHYYYNLGTLNARLDNKGLAVAYLEKAHQMKPHDSDIQHNLKISRAALSRLVGEERLDPASTWPEMIADRFTLDEVRGALGVFSLILMILWTRSYGLTRNLKKTFLQPAGCICAFGLVFTASLYGLERTAKNHPAAVCLEHQVVRSGPGEQYLEVGQVEVGTKLRLLGPSSSDILSSEASQTSGLWYQTRFLPGTIGWVRASKVLAL